MVKDLVTDIEQLSKRSVEWDVRAEQKLSTELVQSLDDTLEAHEELLYLCANEIGYKERAIDVKFSDDTYIFMNPAFQKVDKLILSREFDRHDGKEYIVPRYSEVELAYQDCLGSIKAAKFTDSGAIVICQAMDTIDGLFAHDYGLEIIPEFDQASPEEQEQVIEEYLKSLNDGYKKLDEELSSDEETKGPWNAAKFMRAVSDGEVELEEEKPLSKRKQKSIKKMIEDIKHHANKMKFWRKK